MLGKCYTCTMQACRSNIKLQLQTNMRLRIDDNTVSISYSPLSAECITILEWYIVYKKAMFYNRFVVILFVKCQPQSIFYFYFDIELKTPVQLPLCIVRLSHAVGLYLDIFVIHLYIYHIWCAVFELLTLIWTSLALSLYK